MSGLSASARYGAERNPGVGLRAPDEAVEKTCERSFDANRAQVDVHLHEPVNHGDERGALEVEELGRLRHTAPVGSSYRRDGVLHAREDLQTLLIVIGHEHHVPVTSERDEPR